MIQNKRYCIEPLLTLREVIVQVPTLFEHIQMSTAAKTDAFISEFTAMYNNKYICTYNLEQFKLFIEDKFSEIKRLYERKLEVYDLELNGNDGKKIVRELHELNGSSISNSTTSRDDSESTHYDLPRSTNATATPTTKDSGFIATNGHSSSSGNGNRDVTETITGDVNVIDQRKKWLDYVRDIYRDMCKEFKDCFAIIYC